MDPSYQVRIQISPQIWVVASAHFLERDAKFRPWSGLSQKGGIYRARFLIQVHFKKIFSVPFFNYLFLCLGLILWESEHLPWLKNNVMCMEKNQNTACSWTIVIRSIWGANTIAKEFWICFSSCLHQFYSVTPLTTVELLLIYTAPGVCSL